MLTISVWPRRLKEFLLPPLTSHRGVGKIRMAAEADNANARTPAETADTDILIPFAFMFSMASFDAPFYK